MLCQKDFSRGPRESRLFGDGVSTPSGDQEIQLEKSHVKSYTWKISHAVIPRTAP